MQEAKKMSVVQLTLMVAVNMMGSGIIMLPANMAKVGAISLLSWVGPCCNPHVGGNPSWRASGVQPVQALRYE